MITIMVFASGTFATLKQLSEVTVKGILKTTTDGVVTFDLPNPGTYNVIVKSAGYLTFQGDLVFGQYTGLADVTLVKETPAPTGYTGYCTISSYQLIFGTFFAVNHPDLGRIKDGYSERSKAEYLAHLDERCFTRVPPPPTQEEIITRNVIGRVQSQIDGAITSALSPIQSLVNGIPSMIASMIADALAPITASIAALKVWITESIFELLLKNLNAAAIEYKKKRGA